MFKLLRNKYNVLCQPAQIYVIISLIGVLAILMQNITEPHQYCVGKYSCNLNFSNLFLFAGKLAYIAIWTVILNSLCHSGYKNLAWFFVLVPFVLLFLLIGLFMLSQITN